MIFFILLGFVFRLKNKDFRDKTYKELQILRKMYEQKLHKQEF